MPSAEPVARKGKVRWKATDLTQLVLCLKLATLRGLCGSVQSHNLIVLSSEPDARRGKVEWKATELTHPVWSIKFATRVGICGFEQSHNLTVLLLEPVARRDKVGWKATDWTLVIGILATQVGGDIRGTICRRDIICFANRCSIRPTSLNANNIGKLPLAKPIDLFYVGNLI